MILKNKFLRWWIMKVSEKQCKLWEKYRDIIIIKTERRMNYLVSEPNYHLTKFFTENLLATKMKQRTKKKRRYLLINLSM